MRRTTALPSITDGELLARFITVKKWVRADETIRADAFIPPKDLELSVTRHICLSQERLWRIGQVVANQIANSQGAPLLGRADLDVRAFSRCNLNTLADPLADNANHAIVTGWPVDKPSQKMIAIDLSKAAGKRVQMPPPKTVSSSLVYIRIILAVVLAICAIICIANDSFVAGMFFVILLALGILAKTTTS
jgi:hypothetical protein